MGTIRRPGGRPPGRGARVRSVSTNVVFAGGITYNADMAATPVVVGGGRAEASRLYSEDGYTWALRQAAAVRRGDWDSVDREHVAEEIESVGLREKRAWTDSCAKAVEHLLKIEYFERATPEQLRNWAREVRAFRKAMAKTILDNPGLQGQYAEMFRRAWHWGRIEAVDELTDYDSSGDEPAKVYRRDRERQIPKVCRYRLEDVTAHDRDRDGERGPRPDVWPPDVARVLTEALGERDRMVPRGRGGGSWSR